MPTLRREQLAFYWGLTFVAFGLIIIFVVLYLEAVFHPTHLLPDIALKLFGHMGIASLLLGIVGIIVEFKNWRDYFEERLASTIQKKDFLRTLERDQLKILLKDVFQAYYKVRNLVYEDSFLEFFNTKLQDYIAFPFREDVRGIITIHRPSPDQCCIVEEDISYKCRKVEVESSTIQKEVAWSTDYNDIVGDLRNYYVALQLPDQLPKNFSAPAELQFVHGRVLFKKGDSRLEPTQGAHGFRMSLEAFKEIDELQVQIHLEYMIPMNKFFAWVMNYPARGFHALFHYPEDIFEIVVETFGMEGTCKIETKQPGLYSLTYDSWLLPDDGLAYMFRRPTPQAPGIKGSTATQCADGKELKSKENEQPVTQAVSQPELRDPINKSKAEATPQTQQLKNGEAE